MSVNSSAVGGEFIDRARAEDHVFHETGIRSAEDPDQYIDREVRTRCVGVGENFNRVATHVSHSGPGDRGGYRRIYQENVQVVGSAGAAAETGLEDLTAGLTSGSTDTPSAP